MAEMSRTSNDKKAASEAHLKEELRSSGCDRPPSMEIAHVAHLCAVGPQQNGRFLAEAALGVCHLPMSGLKE